MKPSLENILANYSPEARELYQQIEQLGWKPTHYLCESIKDFIDGLFIVEDGCNVIELDVFIELLNDYRFSIGANTVATTRRIVSAMPKRNKPVIVDGVRYVANLEYNYELWRRKWSKT